MNFSSMSMGQYVPRDSFVHRLDPRAKLISILFLVSAVFAVPDALSLGCCAVVLCGLVALSHLPWGALMRSSRPIFFLAVLTFLFHVVPSLRDEEPVRAALLRGGFVSLRLLILMFFAVLLPLTTAPLELSDGLEQLLGPMGRLGFPAHECGMMVGMALRFIPLLMEETDRILRAQLSRGARLDQGGLVDRIRAFLPVLIPLFVIIFRRADEIALAMEARGYSGGGGRTRRCPLRWKKSDTGATILCVGSAILFLLRGRAL